MNNMSDLVPKSVRLISDQCYNHAVKIEEEHEQVETKFDKRFLSNISFWTMTDADKPTFL